MAVPAASGWCLGGVRESQHGSLQGSAKTAGSGQGPGQARRGCVASCAPQGRDSRGDRAGGRGRGLTGHFQVPWAMHDLALPLARVGGSHPFPTARSLPAALLPMPSGGRSNESCPPWGGSVAACISPVYESTKLSQQAFSIPFICVSPLSSFYFP